MVKVVARSLKLLLAMALIAGAAAIGVLWHEGYRAYVVHTGSMTGTYDPGDLIIDKPMTDALHVGQVITFRHSAKATDVVTHRIVSFKNGAIQTKGDANPAPDVWNIPRSFVRGEVAASIPKGGFVVYFFRQPAGVAAAVTSVIALLLLYGLFFGPTAAVKDGARRADDHDVPADRDVDSLPPLAQAIERLRRGQSLGPPAFAGTPAARSL